MGVERVGRVRGVGVDTLLSFEGSAVLVALCDRASFECCPSCVVGGGCWWVGCL